MTFSAPTERRPPSTQKLPQNKKPATRVAASQHGNDLAALEGDAPSSPRRSLDEQQVNYFLGADGAAPSKRGKHRKNKKPRLTSRL
jgi:hypothetical protein